MTYISDSYGIHIGAPVSIRDVQRCLGSSKNDLATLCMLPNVNMWSGIRPIYHTKISQLSDDDRKGRTLSGYLTGGGIKKRFYGWSDYKNSMDANSSYGNPSSEIWTNDAPYVDGSCAFRLTDFAGYYHNVGNVLRIVSPITNLRNILIPSSDSGSGIDIEFSMDTNIVTGAIKPAVLFGECLNVNDNTKYYPAIILASGKGSSDYYYVKTSGSPLYNYLVNTGTDDRNLYVSFRINTADFASAIASDWRTSHSGNPYQNYPLRDNDKWTACMVLVNRDVSASGGHTFSNNDKILRLEYAANADRWTLPLKQSKYTNIEWMKMTVTITKVSGYQRRYRISSISVTAKMLSTASVSFTIDASLSTPQGTVSVTGVTSGQSVNVTGYSSVTFSGTTGEITKQLSITETVFDNTATHESNQLCNGTLTFRNSDGDFSGTFSIGVSGQDYSYSREVTLL